MYWRDRESGTWLIYKHIHFRYWSGSLKTGKSSELMYVFHYWVTPPLTPYGSVLLRNNEVTCWPPHSPVKPWPSWDEAPLTNCNSQLVRPGRDTLSQLQCDVTETSQTLWVRLVNLRSRPRSRFILVLWWWLWWGWGRTRSEDFHCFFQKLHRTELPPHSHGAASVQIHLVSNLHSSFHNIYIKTRTLMMFKDLFYSIFPLGSGWNHFLQSLT